MTRVHTPHFEYIRKKGMVELRKGQLFVEIGKHQSLEFISL